ncbi:MAG TPA: formate/nitrite transporter family protein, partial [Pirellulales bacterium]|nr:formate/nitrite transporter family protein [Pirellulales bacterium]
GLSAGLDIGFSPFLVAVMLTLVETQFSKPVTEILAANMYAIGFIFVVLGRSELFTEQTTLAVLPVLNGRSSWGGLLRLWGIVYCANMVGTSIFAGLIVLIGPMSGTIALRVLGESARAHSEHPALAIFMSALLAGWLMGLLSWLVTAARDTISQIVIVWLITSAIGFAHLNHVIVGSVQMFAALYVGLSTPGDVGHFILWATLGNIVGGSVFVGLLKYSHAGWADS